jgi:hypothetical protein
LSMLNEFDVAAVKNEPFKLDDAFKSKTGIWFVFKSILFGDWKVTSFWGVYDDESKIDSTFLFIGNLFSVFSSKRLSHNRGPKSLKCVFDKNQRIFY